MFKWFLFYFILSSTFLNAEELDNISIITPISYDKVSGLAHNFRSKFKVGVGDLINVNVSDIVKAQVEPYRKDLLNYFNKPGELDIFVNSTIDEGNKNIFGDSLTDTKMIRFYKFMGTKLIGGIVDRVLETEGVQDSSRRRLWIKKILAPFEDCINKAKNSQYDASHCLEGLTASLVPSAGIALVYELSREKLSPALPIKERGNFMSDQVGLYKDCMKKNSVDASNIKNCAVSAMKSGVLKIADMKLSKTLNDTLGSKNSTKQIKRLVMPDFNYCVKKIGTGKAAVADLGAQFLECVDNLIETTGMQIVKNKILINLTLIGTFSKSDLNKFAEDKANLFRACVRELKSKNIRNDGILDTQICENSVTNMVTHDVVIKTLDKLVKNSFKADNETAIKIGKESDAILDRCWNNKQSSVKREECIRSTILAFSQKVASVKLDEAIPNIIPDKKELIQSNLLLLAKCLDENLPANISEAEDLSTKAAICTDKITRDLAMVVAKKSALMKANEYNIPDSATNELIKNFVEKQFALCISQSLTDETLDNCANQLKRNMILSFADIQIHSKAEGKLDSKALDDLTISLVQNKLADCLGTSPNNTRQADCVSNLTKDATKAIVLAVGKKNIKEQLNTDIVPPELNPINANFESCVASVNLPADNSVDLDECTKHFTLDFARTLGDLKFKSLMKSVLGLNSYNEKKINLENILADYNQCLDKLNDQSVDGGLFENLTICTDKLQKDGFSFVSGTIKTWMTTEDKNVASTTFKNELANIIPCLSSLLPTTPYDPKVAAMTDSVLKPISQMLAKYIEYSPENAQRSLLEIINKLSTDLKDVETNIDSRKSLIDILYTNGTLDQFLKSMVNSQVKEAFDKISETDLPKSLRTTLLSNTNFDKIFASDEGQKLKVFVVENILKPVLVNQAGLDSPVIVAGMAAVKDRVIKMLVNSSDFGQLIINSNVQSSIDKKGFFSKAYVVATFGSLDWKKVRVSSKGQAAEKYIKENILLPIIQGEALTEKEQNLRKAEAEKLVKQAMLD